MRMRSDEVAAGGAASTRPRLSAKDTRVTMRDEIPKYNKLMLPVLQAVDALGGSASAGEIISQVLEDGQFPDEMLSIVYPTREKSILVDRIEWARSYCKLTGALESPKRGLYVVSGLGRSILRMGPADAAAELAELSRRVRKERSKVRSVNDENGGEDDADSDESELWKEELLGRLHRLSPDGFERFSLYLLRSFGMQLTRTGGSGDQGIDGLGTAPLSPVLSTTVAVQAKRYEPSKVVGRETVALFQADAIAAGAEHGILITTARFSGPAKSAAHGRNPTIDLVDGDRLAELCLDQLIGIRHQPTVTGDWFDRFDDV